MQYEDRPFFPGVGKFLFFSAFIGLICTVQGNDNYSLLIRSIFSIIVLLIFTFTFSEYIWKKKFNRLINQNIKALIEPQKRAEVVSQLKLSMNRHAFALRFFSGTALLFSLQIAYSVDVLVVKALIFSLILLVYFAIDRKEQYENEYTEHFMKYLN